MKRIYFVRTDFKIGEQARLTKTISDEDIRLFSKLTGDINPLHLDDDFASRTRFNGRIAHGILSIGLISAVLGTELPGPGGIYLSQNITFIRPVRVNDTLTAEVEVIDWNPSKLIIRMNTHCINQIGEEVVTGEAVLLMESLRS